MTETLWVIRHQAQIVIQREPVADAETAALDYPEREGWLIVEGEIDVGWRYEQGRWAPPPEPDPEQVAADAAMAAEALMLGLRQEMDRRLAESNWSMMMDSGLTTEQQAAWLAYRQALRAMPETADLADPQWPEMPA